MIIFNLWAIPIAVLIYLILLGIERFFPSFTVAPLFGWTLGIVITGIGAITEVVGIRGRIFFMPVWMAGLAIICFQLGWPGTLGFAVALIAGAVVLFKKAGRKEREDWDKVQLELIKAPAAPVDGTQAQFWNWVKAMLFLPIWMKFTPEVCEHNLKVIAALKGAKPSLSARELQKIEALETFLQTCKTAKKPVTSEMKLQDAINDFIRKKARQADPEKPFRLEMRPPIFARS